MDPTSLASVSGWTAVFEELEHPIFDSEHERIKNASLLLFLPHQFG